MHLPAKQCDLLLLVFFKAVTSQCINSKGRPLLQHSTARYCNVSSAATFFLLHQPITSKVSVNAQSTWVCSPSNLLCILKPARTIMSNVLYHASHQKFISRHQCDRMTAGLKESCCNCMSVEASLLLAGLSCCLQNHSVSDRFSSQHVYIAFGYWHSRTPYTSPTYLAPGLFFLLFLFFIHQVSACLMPACICGQGIVDHMS